MSTRIRGQETLVTIAVDGQVQDGSMFNVNDFTVTPKQEITETQFLGRLHDEHDFMHNGFDFNFSVHEQDAVAQDILSDIVARNDSADSHPEITITIRRKYRDPAISDKTEILIGCFIKIDDTSMTGRSDYVATSFSGKCNQRKFR